MISPENNKTIKPIIQIFLLKSPNPGNVGHLNLFDREEKDGKGFDAVKLGGGDA